MYAKSRKRSLAHSTSDGNGDTVAVHGDHNTDESCDTFDVPA